MKAQYVLHLGKNRLLSLMEIEAVTGEKPLDLGEIALVEKIPGDPLMFLNKLGGSIKLSQIVWDGPGQAEVIVRELNRQKPEGKLSFGLNLYPFNRNKLDDLLRKVKKEIKAEGRNGRFLNKGTNLTSATIEKGGLMKDGTDFNLIHHNGGTLISRTIAIQDFESYSQRDYEKPARLAKAGMLPPKLAQTMINLTQLITGPTNFEGKTLYDPFCGSGTILGEALLKGMNVIGSDISTEAIDASKLNLPWIEKTFHTCGTNHLFGKDATQLTRADLPISPDMIVTETYLGPPRSTVLSPEKINEIYRDLMPLYLDFFKTIHPILKPKTPLIIALPIYHTSKGPIRLPDLIDKITPIGYKFNQRLTYHRKEQVVGRDLLILEST